MRVHHFYFVVLWLAALSVAFAFDPAVVICDSQADGLWSEAGTWNSSAGGCTNPPPKIGDTARIENGNSVTLDGDGDVFDALLNIGSMVGQSVDHTLHVVERLHIGNNFTLQGPLRFEADTLSINSSSTIFMQGDVIIEGETWEPTASCTSPITFFGTGTLTLNSESILPAEPFIVADGVTIAGTAADSVCPSPASVGGFAEPLAPEGE